MSIPPGPPNSQPAPQHAPAPASAARPGASYAVDDDVHLLDRLAVLYRYRMIALSVFVLTTLAVMIQGYTAVQVYRTHARVLIEEPRSTAIPGVTSNENTYYEDPEPYYQTQYKILQG